MEFKCFHSWDELPDDSERLFCKAEKESVFLSRAWFENLTDTSLQRHQSLLIACVVEEGNSLQSETTVFAILPLITQPDRQWFSLCHYHTSLYSFLLAEQDRSRVLHCLANGLSQLAFDQLTVGPYAEDDEGMNALLDTIQSTDLNSNVYAQFFNWHHLLQEQSFDTYMKARPSMLQNTIARKQRKLARDHDYEIRLFTQHDLTKAMTDFHLVYQASWKPREIYKNVIEGFVSRFAEQGWVRLGILYINKQPVAAQLWLTAHKKTNIFQLAYDESWKSYSPGSILTRYMMLYAIDTDKVEVMDFLRGNDRYKQDWMSSRRRRWRAVLTREVKSEPRSAKGAGLVWRWINKVFKRNSRMSSY